MWPQWTSMLTPLQWAGLLLVPPALVALYFLKLRRHPIEVPSTYLWRKSIEDLHVNSLWQRLRKNLLLLLQLLLVLFVILALLRPTWQGSILKGDRTIFLIDNSASMGATDIKPTRLDEAKRRVEEMIAQMRTGDVAMIISFNDDARVEQLFTGNRSELRRRLKEIKQSDKSTNMGEALRLASGQANTPRSGKDVWDTKVAEAKPAQLMILSDGKFPDEKNFSLGYLTPTYFPIGAEDAENLAIAAFEAGAPDEKTGKIETFGRIENHGSKDAETDVTLYAGDKLLDASHIKVGAGKSSGVSFQLGDSPPSVLELRLDVQDALAIDNRAWTTINPRRKAKVLLVTPGNEPLQVALATEAVLLSADVRIESPERLATPEAKQVAASGAYDLIIYDRCRPEQPPQSNTLSIGSLPAGTTWTAEKATNVPQIIDINRAHPLMQLIDMGNVIIAEATPLKPPPASTTLIDSNRGILAAIGPREGFEDAVLGFKIFDSKEVTTNWPVRGSFPVFTLNVIKYLGGRDSATVAGNIRPGQSVPLRYDIPGERVQVTLPDKQVVDAQRSKLNTFNVTLTPIVGVYEVRDGKKLLGHFAVNLFSSLESDIRPRTETGIKIGHVEVQRSSAKDVGRRDGWKYLTLAALCILLFEWYIYNRRVYL